MTNSNSEKTPETKLPAVSLSKALVVQAQMPDENAVDEALERILQRKKNKDAIPVAEPMKPESYVAPTWFAQNYAKVEPDDLASRYRQRLSEGHGMMTPDQEQLRKQIEARFQAAKRMAEIQRRNQPTDMRPAPVSVSAVEPRVTEQRQPRPSAQKTTKGHDEGLQRFQDWERKIGRRRLSVEPKPQPQIQPQAALPTYDEFAWEQEPRRTGRGKLAAAVALACLMGGAVGYFTANQPQVLAFYDSLLERSKAVAVALAEPPKDVSPLPPEVVKRETVLTKKPVKIASISVADVVGSLNDPIPLDLSAIPAEPDKPIALRITGLPDEAYLTQGTEIAAGQWLVKPGEFKGLELVVPKSANAQLDLSVAAIEERTGAPAAPTQAMTVELNMENATVLPASAPPESQTPVAKLPAPVAPPDANVAAQDILAKADVLMQSGDVISARQLYLKAHRAGAGLAAFGVAQSFDPVVYDARGIKGLEPDRSRAEEWYNRAVKAGHSGAAEALKALQATR